MNEITPADIVREVRRRRAVIGIETVEQVSARVRTDYANGWFDMNEISTDGLMALLITEGPISDPSLVSELAYCLRELQAMVVGECPSLLNEDSGGDAGLALRIESALAKAHPILSPQAEAAQDVGGASK